MTRLTSRFPKVAAHELAVLALLAVVLLGTFLIYRPGLQGPLLLDDAAYLPHNRVSSLSSDALLQNALSGQHAFVASRAIPRLSFAITQYWSGADASYRLKQQNLLLHLANGLLVFWLVWLLAREQLRDAVPSTRRFSIDAGPMWFALAAMTIWLLHPLQVSTVLYVTQRFVLTAAFFMLAALVCYVKGRSLVRTRAVSGAGIALVGVALFGVLGLLSKAIAALLPLLILTIEWVFFRMPKQRAQRLAVATILVVLVAVPIALGALYVAPRIDNMLGWQQGRGFSGVERLMTQAHVIALYLKLYFIPIPGEMSLFHDMVPVTRQLDAGTLLLGLLYGSLTVGAVLLRKAAPWIAFGILWFFICHLMESTILSLELVFEHRNYLAILGLTVALLGGLRLVLQRPKVKRIGLAAAAALLAMLALNTAVRAADWASLERLLTVEYQREPRSPRVLSELLEYARSRDNVEAARGYLNQLLALDLPEATAELAAIYTYCPQGGVPPALYRGALAKLENNVVSPTTVTPLVAVVNKYLQRQCPAIEFGQLLELTDAARTSKRIRSAGQNCTAAELQVRLLMQQNDWERAGTVLGELFERCGARMPSVVRASLDNILRFGFAEGRLAETRAMLIDVAREPKRRTLLDGVYAQVGGFDIGWLVEHRLRPDSTR